MNLSDLREALNDVLSEVDELDRPRLYRILRQIAIRAEAGDVRAAALILDRAFGAPQPLALDTQKRHTIYIDVARRTDEDQIERTADGTPPLAE